MAPLIGAQFNRRARQSGAEAEQRLWVGARAAVDALVGVEKEGERVLGGEKLCDEASLQGIEVLTFVNEHMGVAGLIERPPVHTGGEQVGSVDEQILEIQTRRS